MIENFTGKYQLAKTLRFSLIPQGKTEEFIEGKILEQDEKLSVSYVEMKKLIDKYHITFIEECLGNCWIKGLEEYALAYFGSDKNNAEKDNMIKMEENFRKQIVQFFVKNKDWDSLFKKELIQNELFKLDLSDDEKTLVNQFKKFTTYFNGFHTNRKNMYSDEEKSTAISYRIVNQNLPKYLDNIKAFEKIKNDLGKEYNEIETDIWTVFDIRLQDIFSVEYFNMVLSQKGIDTYNAIIGGYTTSNGDKIKGLNEYINLFNQRNKSAKLPKLKMLYKQILSDRETISFIPEKFENDNEVLQSIQLFYIQKDNDKSIEISLQELKKLLNHIEDYDANHIYVKNDSAITQVSKLVTGNWADITEAINRRYDEINNADKAKNWEKYIEKRRLELKKVESYSLSQLDTFVSQKTNANILECIGKEASRVVDDVAIKYSEVKRLLVEEYPEDKKLISDDVSIGKIKSFLDSIKSVQILVGLLRGSGKEAEKDLLFYGEFDELNEKLNLINALYDKVRNYVTQKPYSKDKFKLNFDCSTLLDGWDKNKEKDNLSVLLRKQDKYFLAIMDKKNNKIFQDVEDYKGDNYYEKITYKLLPGPNKMLPKVFLSKKGIEKYNPSKEILEAYEKGTHKKGILFNRKDCHRLIDFFKENIEKNEDWADFKFKYSETESYEDISGFYKEISEQGYKLTFNKISQKFIDQLVDEGKLYLFQIYNKDFSENSKGNPNLHTMYFKALFDNENLKNVVYKLNGQAEVFYRKASIKIDETVVHEKNKELNNKNSLRDKKTSTFAYDIIKNRRFTKHQFSFHVPITLNFKAPSRANINDEVRNIIKQSKSQYVIGIDRGERHLLYVSVINEKAEIVEQYSLNEIVNEFKGKEYKVNYHQLLEYREKDRLEERKNWKSIDSIKELKEGYISQVVHKICLLVEKYDAIIVMEDLNSGFKNSRIKVEKQVYQKFEKMLIDKLSYYVNKTTPANENGGIFNAYQLTNTFESFQKMGKQNGIIFYIPAWLTSKIDPSTGFVDLLRPKYTSVNAGKEFISKFDNIKFNEEENMFEFSFNYDYFPGGVTDYKKKWTIYTNGERIETFRNKENNSQWDSVTINLTLKLKELFDTYGIRYDSNNIQEAIMDQTDSKFFKALIHIIHLMLQMRNSVTGTEIDYLVSPVKNKNGEFYNSNNYQGLQAKLPDNADANGAYNIAKKGLWAVQQIKNCEDVKKVKLAISNREWLEYTQN